MQAVTISFHCKAIKFLVVRLRPCKLAKALDTCGCPRIASSYKRKIPFYTCAISPNLEGLEFCAVLGTNTGGLHITLAIPNFFFRENLCSYVPAVSG